MEKETDNVVPADFVTFFDQCPPDARLVEIVAEDRISTALADGIIRDVIIPMTKRIERLFFIIRLFMGRYTPFVYI